MKAKAKFDWPIDPINLGAQLIKIKDLKDYPKMIKEFDEKKLIDFFLEEIQKLGEAVLE